MCGPSACGWVRARSRTRRPPLYCSQSVAVRSPIKSWSHRESLVARALSKGTSKEVTHRWVTGEIRRADWNKHLMQGRHWLFRASIKASP